MNPRRRWLLAGAFSLCAAATAIHAAPPAIADPVAAMPSADARLRAVFAASDEDELRRNPLDALGRGDLRYASQFGDYLSDAYYAAERAAAERDLAELRSIDRASLTATDQIAYDVFAYRQQSALRALSPAVLRIERLLPLDQMNGLQVNYPDVVSGKGIAPFNTVADYDASLARVDGFVKYIDTAIALMREGMREGITQPRVVVIAMLKEIDALEAQGIAGSTFMGPVQHFPASISAADQARFQAAYAQALTTKILPAYQRLGSFLQTDYLPAARTTIGLSALPGGAALYAEKIAEQTTLPLSADEVHKLGLAQVAKDRAEMEAIKQQLGFQGDLPAFFNSLRANPALKFASKEAMAARYQALKAIVESHVPEQFDKLPKAPLEIRPVPAFKEAVAPPAYYQRGTPDGSRPGVFFYNSYDLPSRATYDAPTFFLHEGIPGHHFQIGLAQENTALPAFMRFGGDTAFVEGWALYAESLWQPMGVEKDPYDRFGGLNADIWRAIRLVVDSGIHAEGWTRDQSIQYFLDNSGVSRTNATAEVDRYIAYPAQALTYKIGQLTILRLKQEARDALGARFDPRAFHDQVLMTGSLPLPVLEAKIHSWIAAEKAAG